MMKAIKIDTAWLAPTHDGDIFSWHGRRGTCEASDLKPKTVDGYLSRMSEHRGFYVKGRVSTQLFIFRQNLFDISGVYLGGLYTTAPQPAFRRLDRGPVRFEITVFND